MADWTRGFFKEGVFSPGMEEALRAAPIEARFLWKTLNLRRGSRVLDVPCGTGRHAVLLAKRGADVVGVDYNEDYVAAARAAGRKAGRAVGTLEARRGDMRRLPYRAEFDAAYNVWTSFGYFERPQDDLATLQAARRALKPGGLFLIDVIDFAWVKRHHEPYRLEPQADGAWRFERVRLLGGADPAIDSDWLLMRLGEPPKHSRFFVRGYDEKRLSALLRRAGLAPLKRWRSLGGSPGASGAGSRLVILARKS